MANAAKNFSITRSHQTAVKNMSADQWPHELMENYFASGSNHFGEIRGLANSGMHVGVAVDVLDEEGRAEAELKMLACTGTKVFVDSGAFGEVEFNAPIEKGKKKGQFPHPDHEPFTWVTVKPITDADWDERLSTYERLAAELKDACYLVAPDKVGDQVETLCRLERYAERIKRLQQATYCNVIVPIQGIKGGELSAIEFDQEVRRIFDDCGVEGGFHYVRGIPSKKAAADVEDIKQFVDDLVSDETIEGTDLRSLAFHLLGLGPYGGKRYFDVSAIMPPWARMTCDSVRIMALVGLHNGPNHGPRDLTRRRYAACEARGLDPEVKITDTDLVGEIKTETVRGHFNDELQWLLARSTDLGWYDEELAANDDDDVESEEVEEAVYGADWVFSDEAFAPALESLMKIVKRAASSDDDWVASGDWDVRCDEVYCG